jgi:phosphonate transport system substrate-binding protein
MKWLRILFGISGAVVLTWLVGRWVAVGSDRGADGAGHRLVFALAPDKDPDAMQEERIRFSAWLTAALGHPVEVIVPLSGAVIAEGFANGTIDAAHLSATAMARLVRDGSGTLLVAGRINGQTTYSSVWLARRDHPYRGVEDLRGQPVAFASPTSTSGYIIPAWDLAQRGLIDARTGLEAFFGRNHVLFGTGYVSAVERVLSGQAVAAAVSDYVWFGDKHLTPEQKAQLAVVQSQGPVPTHVIAVSRALDPGLRAGLRAAFLTMHQQQPELAARMFGAQWVESDDGQHLAGLQAALAFVESLR